MNTKKWKYEPETKTIRSVPENYWIATMDSFDGAVDHKANALAISKVPEMIELLKIASVCLWNAGYKFEPVSVDKLLAEIEGDV